MNKDKKTVDAVPSEEIAGNTVQADAKPQYEPPRIVVYDESTLRDVVGPAAACASWL